MSALEPCYLLHDSTFDPQRAADWLQAQDITLVAYGDRDSIANQSRVLLWLGDEQVRDLAPLGIERQWRIGLLAHPEAREACAALGVKGEPAGLAAYYREIEPIAADALSCNGELVFSSVVIGSVLSLRPQDINRQPTTWSLLRLSLIHISEPTRLRRKSRIPSSA